MTSTQTRAEPEGQPKLIAVAPVQKRKSKTKLVCTVNGEEEAGPLHPAEETGLFHLNDSVIQLL